MWDCENCGAREIAGGEYGLEFCPQCHIPRVKPAAEVPEAPEKPADKPPKTKARQQSKEGADPDGESVD